MRPDSRMYSPQRSTVKNSPLPRRGTVLMGFDCRSTLRFQTPPHAAARAFTTVTQENAPAIVSTCPNAVAGQQYRFAISAYSIDDGCADSLSSSLTRPNLAQMSGRGSAPTRAFSRDSATRKQIDPRAAQVRRSPNHCQSPARTHDTARNDDAPPRRRSKALASRSPVTAAPCAMSWACISVA